MDVLDVVEDEVVVEVIKLSLFDATNETPPKILGTLPSSNTPYPAIGIEVYLFSAVSVSDPCWRYPRHDVVVVDPSAVIHGAGVHESFVPDAGAAKGM